MSYGQEQDNEKLSTLQDMEECSRKVREEWGISAKFPVFNTQLLLMQHGIDVIVCEGVDKFDGVSLVAYDKPIIVLNSIVDNAERRRFTTMHELGHLLFNKYMAEELTQVFDVKVYRALAQNLITESKASSLLKLPLAEVRNKVNAI